MLHVQHRDLNKQIFPSFLPQGVRRYTYLVMEVMILISMTGERLLAFLCQNIYAACERHVVLPVVQGENVDFYFSLQPHCLGSYRAGQWEHLAEELDGSANWSGHTDVSLGGLIYTAEQRK